MEGKTIYTFTLGKIQFEYNTYKETLRTVQIFNELKVSYLLDVRFQKRGKHGRGYCQRHGQAVCGIVKIESC